MTLAIHILTIRNGEVYLHHFWLLLGVAIIVMSCAGSTYRSGK